MESIKRLAPIIASMRGHLDHITGIIESARPEVAAKMIEDIRDNPDVTCPIVRATEAELLAFVESLKRLRRCIARQHARGRGVVRR